MSVGSTCRGARRLPHLSGRLLPLVALASTLLLAPAATGATEIVIFENMRVEIVAGHRVEGDWTYLTVKDGEVGVPTVQILEIREATPEESALFGRKEVLDIETFMSLQNSPGDRPGSEATAPGPKPQGPKPVPLIKSLSVQEQSSTGGHQEKMRRRPAPLDTRSSSPAPGKKKG